MRAPLRPARAGVGPRRHSRASSSWRSSWLSRRAATSGGTSSRERVSAAVEGPSAVLGHDGDHAVPRQPRPAARRLVGAEPGDVIDLWHSEAFGGLDAVGDEVSGEYGRVGMARQPGRRRHLSAVRSGLVLIAPPASSCAGEMNWNVDAPRWRRLRRSGWPRTAGGCGRVGRWIEQQRREIDGRRVDGAADEHGEVGHQQTSGEQDCRRRDRGRHTESTTSSERHSGASAQHTRRRVAMRGLGAGGRR